MLSSLFVLALSFSVIGQNTSSTFSIDIHGGLTASQVQGDGLSGFDKLGVIAGLGVSTSINNNWDALLELNFLQKGSVKRPDAEIGDYTEYKMSLSYAQIPVMIKYHLSHKFNFSAGPAFGKLLSSKEQDRDGEIQSQIDFEEWEISAGLGAGYSFSERFAINVRLDSSLFPIRQKPAGNYNNLRGKQYNSSLILFISYSIN